MLKSFNAWINEDSTESVSTGSAFTATATGNTFAERLFNNPMFKQWSDATVPGGSAKLQLKDVDAALSRPGAKEWFMHSFNLDSNGNPLEQAGSTASPPVDSASSPMGLTSAEVGAMISSSAIRTVGIADSQGLISILNKYVGKKEEGENSGEMVKGFLKSVGLGTGNPWCMAFVYAIFDELCKSKGMQNPLPKTGSVLTFWSKAPAENKIGVSAALQNPSLVTPGQIFIKSRQGGGHTGIVLKAEGDSFISIDGNSSDKVKLNRYKIANMLGFVDYFKNPVESARLAELSRNMITTHAPTLGGGKEV
jgi:hypothetical protein